MLSSHSAINDNFISEVESSRTSLASRTSSKTHFEVLGLGLEGQVLGLGLEASSPRKSACPRLEDSTFFELLKFCGALEKFFWKRFFVITWKIFVKTFFFWRALALVTLVFGLGLKHSCSWPGECLSWGSCPWPWPRIFLCPWPWPRALCLRLHLCFVYYCQLCFLLLRRKILTQAETIIKLQAYNVKEILFQNRLWSSIPRFFCFF